MADKKHTWNHRVIRHVTENPPEVFYQIHEVHYEDGVPKLVTNDGARVGGDDIEEMKETLGLMLKSLENPTIDMSYFDNLKDDDVLSDDEKKELEEHLRDIQEKHPEAWESLKQDPDKFIIELLKEKERRENQDTDEEQSGC